MVNSTDRVGAAWARLDADTRSLLTAYADGVNRYLRTVKFFTDNGIPLDRPWGQVQFDLRNGEAVPIHGGSGGSGVYNAIVPGPLVPGVGTTPIFGGSNWVQSVTFGPNGPDAHAVLTYSQSSDPANPHYADMTRLFSAFGWVRLPFAEATSGAIRTSRC